MNRAQLRAAFLRRHCGGAKLQPLQPDASARRYFRVRGQPPPAMLLMDAPPPDENVTAFDKVTRRLQTIGVRAPRLYAMDAAHGFLLLEDLGDDTFTRLLAADFDETELYKRAITTLAKIHKHPRALDISLPSYDADLAWNETKLMLDWYLPAREIKIDAAARAEFKQIWRRLITDLPPLPPALVLRDFHMDNLMLADDGARVAVLDYQDAVVGSPAYDLVSLLQDARRDVAPGLADEMFNLYRAQNPELDADALLQHYYTWGAQRHCKVAGIFTRLSARDNKDAYLQHLPRVLRLLKYALAQPYLTPLRNWFQAHQRPLCL